MVNVCVQHFNLYMLPKSKLTNANILCLVRFRLEQISAFTDLVTEQWQLDRSITTDIGIFLQEQCTVVNVINLCTVFCSEFSKNAIQMSCVFFVCIQMPSRYMVQNLGIFGFKLPVNVKQEIWTFFFV